MTINLHILNARGTLTPYIKTIESIFNNTINKITKKVQISNIDIIIADNLDNTIPEIGIGGYVPNANLIYISLNPKHPRFKISLNEDLDRTLTHEIHHCIRWKSKNYGTSLLEAIIWEGLADHFEIEISNKKPEPWSIALSKKQIKIFLEKAKKEFSNKKYNHEAWFFGDKNKKIPRWTAYSLGFYLVDQYLKKYPQKKPSQLYNIEAKEFANLI